MPLHVRIHFNATGAVAQSNGRLSAPFLRLGSVFCEESQFYNGTILSVEDMMEVRVAQWAAQSWQHVASLLTPSGSGDRPVVNSSIDR
jgi:hypothetical protein